MSCQAETGIWNEASGIESGKSRLPYQCSAVHRTPRHNTRAFLEDYSGQSLHDEPEFLENCPQNSFAVAPTCRLAKVHQLRTSSARCGLRSGTFLDSGRQLSAATASADQLGGHEVDSAAPGDGADTRDPPPPLWPTRTTPPPHAAMTKPLLVANHARPALDSRPFASETEPTQWTKSAQRVPMSATCTRN